MDWAQGAKRRAGIMRDHNKPVKVNIELEFNEGSEIYCRGTYPPEVRGKHPAPATRGIFGQ